MYLNAFGLTEKPFHITPDPRFIFLSKNHKEAFAHLLYGIRQRVGFLSLIGEVGTGKTTVLRTLLRQLEQNDYHVALIFNPCLSALELLETIHREFGIPWHIGDDNLSSLHDSLNRFLLEQRKQGKTVVLVIDEAQNLDPSVLEQLRLLSNLETETDKLLQLVIVGQPELEAVLDRQDLRQLKQRLTVRYRLQNMDAEDTRAYIRHRLKVAGFNGVDLFTTKALARIYRLSGGLPRLINILCDRALLVAYTREKSVVDQTVVAEAQAELDGSPLIRRRHWPLVALLACASAVAVLLLGYNPSYFDSLGGPKSPTDPEIAALSPRPAPPTKRPIASESLTEIKAGIAALDEEESARSAATAVLARWGKPALENFEVEGYRPLESALSRLDMSSVRFQGDLERLRAFNSPAILSLVLPNLRGRRYVALLQVEDHRVKLEPALSADGWLSLDLLKEIWFGRAIIPWVNFDRLPYFAIPGEENPDVRRMQILLGQAGYPTLNTSGIYDQETIAAVSDLQKRTGLAPDGRIGARTLLQIYRLAGREMPMLTKETSR